MSRVNPDPTLRIDTGGVPAVLEASQWIAGAPHELFPFFEDPRNLERLTPPFLRFRILSVSTPKIQAETRILYRLRIHGVPVYWRTRIAEWNPPFGFADEQLCGPYRRWYHRHLFVPEGDGTRVIDRVEYRLFCHDLSRTRLLAWVHEDVEGIFRYRQTVLPALVARERAADRRERIGRAREAAGSGLVRDPASVAGRRGLDEFRA